VVFVVFVVNSLSSFLMHQEIILKRDCDAIQIPSGTTLVLPAGTQVIVTQSLGGTFTVATPGGLARIDQKDTDALGIDPSTPAPAKTAPEGTLEEAVWNQLKTVFDPEIPVNVVDLGLIYDCTIVTTENGQTKAEVKMTLTAPGCGMGPTIAADARSKILTIEGIDEAEVELVWDPAWNQNMISEAGRMKLGMV
jgi:probable FeS assembly SUF system protein SufT